jgi:cytochrome c2
MKTALRVAALTLGATLFYAYVGHMVPQQITYPPEDVELKANMTTEEMVKTGGEIVATKGTCLACHTIGSDAPGRFPDLGGIGARASTRKSGMSDIDYLAESLYEPNAYIVEGFSPGMISPAKPPVSLTDGEILTVIAYLQSLGGNPTVTMQTKVKWAGQAPGPAKGAPAGTALAGAGAGLDGAQLLQNYACVTCHKLDTPEKLIGPSLYDVGDRLSNAKLYESIMDPDATLAEGFPGGVMIATLKAVGFYDKVSAGEVKTMVEYLAQRKRNG